MFTTEDTETASEGRPYGDGDGEFAGGFGGYAESAEYGGGGAGYEQFWGGAAAGGEAV